MASWAWGSSHKAAKLRSSTSALPLRRPWPPGVVAWYLAICSAKDSALVDKRLKLLP